MAGKVDPQVTSPTGDLITSTVGTSVPIWAGWLLALATTMLSVAVSGLVGWQRGGALVESYLLAAIGVLAVMGAHLLLPLLRTVQSGVVLRLVGVLLWVVCLVYTATSHAGFFIAAEARHADSRIAVMELADVSSTVEPKRRLSTILEEMAVTRSKWMQISLTLASCEVSCETLKVRQSALKDRVAVLEAEESEARHWLITRDEMQRRREALRDDPVASKLKRDFGVTPAGAGAVTVLPVAVMLEGLGTLCWCLILQGRPKPVASDLPKSVTDTLTTVISPVSGAVASNVVASLVAEFPPAGQRTVTPLPMDGVLPHDDVGRHVVLALAGKVWTEIQEGRVRPTVRAIRAELGIAQEQARAVAEIIRAWQAAGKVTYAQASGLLHSPTTARRHDC